ncbi:unnamed protein product [Malassezia sympodialis ATCC 42132]|uniref:uncharacterized protein n=1 Tax=Malassezia sympodialis (strain ATCC 42132) TaxID=1230383 RepID=UPI0002C1941B|nr:uncharacterized protein MSY001_1495 [Malassezia sympodialis ATCC 42132]CCU98789.1 unnamed protein product [Malassezia sympodialis ATCC 42132]|eukprot:XP_018740073.1 uncharacterized protein MSY001_1495 [Malassezia sympodialis ATCC 42132]
MSNADPNQHGVDLILGGHDHVYYLGRGINNFKGADFDHDMIGSEDDKSTLIVKSGTDFHDLSEVHISLSEPHPDTCVRRRTIECITGTPEDPSLPELQVLLDKLMKRISKSTQQPVALSLNEWDVTSKAVRTDESGFGDFVADILLMSMERTLRTQSPEQNENAVSGGYRMADCSIICGGSLRSDSTFGPGEITLGNLMEIMPFEDPIVVKELTGQDIWDALENGFSAYPKQEGRFPQVAGMQIVWDSRREPGHRVISVDFLHQPFDGEITEGKDVFMKIRDSYLYEPDHCSNNEQSVMVHRAIPKVKKPLKLDQTYWVVTREYLAQGNDGYLALRRGRYIIDDESGQLMSAIVRKFLLGATYIWRWNHVESRKPHVPTVPDSPSASDSSFDSSFSVQARKRRRTSLLTHLFNTSLEEPVHLSLGTSEAVQRANELRLRRSNSFRKEQAKSGYVSDSDTEKRRDPLFVDYSPTSIRDALFVASHEHHSHYDTASRIDTNLVLEQGCKKEDLAVVVALPDGRMSDRGRQS